MAIFHVEVSDPTCEEDTTYQYRLKVEDTTATEIVASIDILYPDWNMIHILKEPVVE